MAPPVQARTLSLAAYILLTMVTFCVIVVLIIADTASGVVQAAIAPLRQTVKPVSCEPSLENDGLLIHIDCPIRKLHRFTTPPEFAANLPGFEGIFFEMKVEMYQYNVLPGLLRSRIGGQWSDSLIPSSAGWAIWSQNRNPEFFPYVPGAGRHFGTALYGGGFKLERPHIISFHTKKRLPLIDDGSYTASIERPPTRLSSTNTRVFDNHLYTGDPKTPHLGDLRISFYGSAATHLSAIGVQSSSKSWLNERSLLGFHDPFSHNNKTRTLVLEGDYTARDLLDAFSAENDIPSAYIWITRTLAFVTLWTWVYFTKKVTSSKVNPPATDCVTRSDVRSIMSTATVALSACLFIVGMTKLSYSLWACLACVLSAVFVGLFKLACGDSSDPQQAGYRTLILSKDEIELENNIPLPPTGGPGSEGKASYIAL